MRESAQSPIQCRRVVLYNSRRYSSDIERSRSASTPSPDALTLLLDLDDLDVDLQNRLDRFTPLHMAVRLENEAARMGVMEMLLDAGADPRYVDQPRKARLAAVSLLARSIPLRLR